MRKPTKISLRNKADKLLQEYIKKVHTNCLVCGAPIHCGHHFFTKASSNALRYYIPNIIPICRDCHCRVHTQPHLVDPKICFIKGQEWYEDLENVKRAGVKANLEWYQSVVKNLEVLLEAIN